MNIKRILLVIPLLVSSLVMNQPTPAYAATDVVYTTDAFESTAAVEAGSVAWQGQFDRPFGITATLDAEAVYQPNLAINGDFENSTISPWTVNQHNGAVGSISQDSTQYWQGVKSGKATITTAGTLSWHVQFEQLGMSFKNATNYYIAFKAKASTARNIGVQVLQQNSPFNSLMAEKTFAIGVNWNIYTTTFTSPFTETAAKLAFLVGLNTGNVWIDDVYIGLQPVYAMQNNTSINRALGRAPKVLNKPNFQTNTPKTVNVFVIAYHTENTGWAEWENLKFRLQADLNAASKFKGVGDQSLNYVIGGTTVVEGAAPTIPAGQPNAGQRDIAAIYNQYSICPTMNGGGIQQVWIWSNGFDSPHNVEFASNGYNGYVVNGKDSNTPECGESGTVFEFVYANRDRNGVWARASAHQALHTYGHFIEFRMYRYAKDLRKLWPNQLTCDFIDGSARYPSVPYDAPVPPYDATNQICPLSPYSATWGFTNHAKASNNNKSMCGDIHNPANILDSALLTTNEYIYTSTATVQSKCGFWFWGNSAETSVGVNCLTWSNDCNSNNISERGFILWWMQRIPGYALAGDIQTNRSGQQRENMWDVVAFGPNWTRPTWLVNSYNNGIRNSANKLDWKSLMVVYRPSNGHFYLKPLNGSLTSTINLGMKPCIVTATNAVPYLGNITQEGNPAGPFQKYIYDKASGNRYLLRIDVCQSLSVGTGKEIGFARNNAGGGSQGWSFIPSTGVWNVNIGGLGCTVCCSVSFTMGAPLSGTNYTAMMADYDGDGVAEAIVWHQASGKWIIRKLTPAASPTCVTPTDTIISFGLSSINAYTGATGDVNRDGKFEPIVYEKLGRKFYWYNRETNKVVLVDMGAAIPTDGVPAIADYTGDGYIDWTVFSGGNFYMRDGTSTSNIITVVNMGLPGDIPVAKDW